MQPAWLVNDLAEEWPAVSNSLDFGAFEAHDLDARTVSSSSSLDGAGTVLKGQGTLIQHDSVSRGSARVPLGVIASSSSRGIFQQSALEALFQPLTEEEKQQSTTTPAFAFDFQCPTAIRIEPEPPKEAPASPLAAHASSEDRIFSVESIEYSQELEQDAEGGMDEDCEDRDGLGVRHRLSPDHSPAKRARLDPEYQAQLEVEEEERRREARFQYLGAFMTGEVGGAPNSAVRERIRARRDGRRVSLPPSFGTPRAEVETPDRPIRHSMPATTGSVSAQLFSASTRQAKAANVMQQVRSQEPFFTPVRAPTVCRDSVPPMTLGAPSLETVIEDEEEGLGQSLNSPYERPLAPTPRQSQPQRSFLSSLLGRDTAGLPLTPRRPADDALAASAVDQIIVPSPDASTEFALAINTALPPSTATSPEMPTAPRSALKRPAHESNGQKSPTPRSVSFGVRPELLRASSNEERKTSGLRYEIEGDESAASTRELAEAAIAVAPAQHLALSSLGHALDQLASSGASDSSTYEQLPIVSAGPSDLGSSGTSTCVFAGQQARRSLRFSENNATFLTECSFGFSREDLIRAVSSVEPYEPHWQDLLFIDLSGKGIVALVRLKEILPTLEEIILNDNQISHLTGIPEGIRAMGIARNDLTDVSSFSMLSRLERLDISSNKLESLSSLSCLHHLRELKADDNEIADIEGLRNMNTLVKLSLRKNKLASFDALEYRWPQLEYLDLAGNAIQSFAVAERTCDSLVSLNLDSNLLASFSTLIACPALRVLRICRNPLKAVQLHLLTGLRTLFVDETKLRTLGGLGKLQKLENLSLRTVQTRRDTSFSPQVLREMRRVYLSGQTIDWQIFSQSCYNLVYLELVMCRLTSLPADLADCLPNCRTLALDYNSIEDVTALSGMKRLKRLSMPANQIAKCQSLHSLLAALPEIEVVDTRGNPCVAKYYLPTPLQSTPAQADHAMHGVVTEEKAADCHDSLGSQAWRDADAIHLSNLPDRLYVRRSVWRCLAFQAAPSLRHLDGLRIKGEAEQGQALLKRLSDEGELGKLCQGL